MFISEIPVRCLSSTDNGEKTIQWIGDLNHRTTVRDVIESIFPGCDSAKYSLYIHTDRKKQVLNETSRIYQIVSKINQRKSSRRILFEIRSKKRVRFADEILVQTISQRPSKENLLEKLKENFQKHVHQQQEKYLKGSSLKIIHENLPRSSSSESGISSHSSTDDLLLPTKRIFETLV